MGKYRVTTEDGVYEITTEDTQPSVDPRARVGQFVTEAAANIPASAVNLLKSIPHMGEATLAAISDPPKAFAALAERYGSVDKALDSLKRDPVGVGADLFMLWRGGRLGVSALPETIVEAPARAAAAVERGAEAVARGAGRVGQQVISIADNPAARAAAGVVSPRLSHGMELLSKASEARRAFQGSKAPVPTIETPAAIPPTPPVSAVPKQPVAGFPLSQVSEFLRERMNQPRMPETPVPAAASAPVRPIAVTPAEPWQRPIPANLPPAPEGIPQAIWNRIGAEQPALRDAQIAFLRKKGRIPPAPAAPPKTSGEIAQLLADELAKDAPPPAPGVATPAPSGPAPKRVAGVKQVGIDAEALANKFQEWGFSPDEAGGMNAKGWERAAFESGIPAPTEAVKAEAVFRLTKKLVGPKRSVRQMIEDLQKDLATSRR